MKKALLSIALLISIAPIVVDARKREPVPQYYLWKTEEQLRHLMEFDKNLFWDTLESMYLDNPLLVERNPWLNDQFMFAMKWGLIDSMMILEYLEGLAGHEVHKEN